MAIADLQGSLGVDSHQLQELPGLVSHVLLLLPQSVMKDVLDLPCPFVSCCILLAAISLHSNPAPGQSHVPCFNSSVTGLTLHCSDLLLA